MIAARREPTASITARMSPSLHLGNPLHAIREGIEYNYRMIIVSDAVAEVHRDTHDAELKTMARMFADVKSSDEMIGMLTQG